MYPVSAHGVHSRRTSDKRTLDTFIPMEADEQGDARAAVGPQDAAGAGTPSAFLRTPVQQRSSLWENLLVSRTGEATFERGAWDVAGGQIVGIRRRPRMPLGSGSVSRAGSRGAAAVAVQPKIDNRGLTPATLERWELWTFDPATSLLRASPLLALDVETRAAVSSRSGSPRAELDAKPDGVRTAATVGAAHVRRKVTVDLVPRLHFTRVAPFVCQRTLAFAGFGNTVGIFELAGASGTQARQRASLERMRSSSS